MKAPAFVLRILYPLGIACVVIGTLDPLEGSPLIVAGFAMIAAKAYLTHSRDRTLLTWAFALSAVGVAAMWILSSFGGVRFGADGPGLPGWWALTMLPYPIGWVLGIVGTVRSGRARGSGAPTPA
jgi:hypothetical protein